MSRTVRRVVLLVVVLAVVGIGVLAVTSRPPLQRAKDTVEARWSDLRPGLDTRYRALEATAAAVGKVPGPPRSVVNDISSSWRTWREGAGVGREVELANELEGLGRRLIATVAASAAIRSDPAVQQATSTFVQAPIPDQASAFNEAVRDYQRERDSGLRSLVANPLGYRPIPALDTGTTAGGSGTPDAGT